MIMRRLFEIVGDAACELPDGFHLLALTQGLFNLFPRGHALGDSLFKSGVKIGQLIGAHVELRIKRNERPYWSALILR